MNLFKIINELLEEKKRIDKVIGALEELAKGKSPESSSGPEAVPATEQVKRKRGRPRRDAGKQPPAS